MSPYTEEALRQMAEADARHRGKAWLRGEAVPLVDSRYGARTLGAVAEVTLGCELWARDSLEGRLDRHGDPLGGIVVGLDAGGPPTWDAETGERILHPARFECYDHLAPWPHRAFTWLAEEQVDPSSIGPASPAALALAVRRFAAEVCQHQRKSKLRTLSSFEADLMRYGFLLSAVLMGER